MWLPKQDREVVVHVYSHVVSSYGYSLCVIVNIARLTAYLAFPNGATDLQSVKLTPHNMNTTLLTKGVPAVTHP